MAKSPRLKPLQVWWVGLRNGLTAQKSQRKPCKAVLLPAGGGFLLAAEGSCPSREFAGHLWQNTYQRTPLKFSSTLVVVGTNMNNYADIGLHAH